MLAIQIAIAGGERRVDVAKQPFRSGPVQIGAGLFPMIRRGMSGIQHLLILDRCSVRRVAQRPRTVVALDRVPSM